MTALIIGLACLVTLLVVFMVIVAVIHREPSGPLPPPELHPEAFLRLERIRADREVRQAKGAINRNVDAVTRAALHDMERLRSE